MWAYTYAHLAEIGVDIVGAAELIDYPGQFAATTLVDWETGKPNARYWVVKLLHDNFGPGTNSLPRSPCQIISMRRALCPPAEIEKSCW